MRFTPPDGVLNLAQTLDCGQSFRFYPVTLENNIPAWRGVAFSRGLTVYQDENNDLVLDCTEQEFRDIWFDYFDFNTDYKKSREVLSALHPALKEAAEFAGGIRILKQEPFEALCSFIISQNNNIPRIKGIIERLCLHFGEPFLYHNETRYAFPLLFLRIGGNAVIPHWRVALFHRLYLLHILYSPLACVKKPHIRQRFRVRFRDNLFPHTVRGAVLCRLLRFFCICAYFALIRAVFKDFFGILLIIAPHCGNGSHRRAIFIQ